jgi:beta-glucuronidase
MSRDARQFGWSLAHGDEQTRFSEKYQAGLFRHQIASLRKTPSLAGMSPWVLVDFRSPRRFLPEVQDFHNRRGFVSDKGQKKQAFMCCGNIMTS